MILQFLSIYSMQWSCLSQGGVSFQALNKLLHCSDVVLNKKNLYVTKKPADLYSDISEQMIYMLTNNKDCLDLDFVIIKKDGGASVCRREVVNRLKGRPTEV
jgi:hypothetical protein